MSIEINATETREYFIGWQDEASGGLEISTIIVQPVHECERCGETMTVGDPDDWCDCDEPIFGETWIEIEYPSNGRGTHVIDVDLEGLDVERELRDARDAAWPVGAVLFIAENIDEIHDQFDAFIAETENEEED